MNAAFNAAKTRAIQKQEPAAGAQMAVLGQMHQMCPEARHF